MTPNVSVVQQKSQLVTAFVILLHNFQDTTPHQQLSGQLLMASLGFLKPAIATICDGSDLKLLEVSVKTCHSTWKHQAPNGVCELHVGCCHGVVVFLDTNANILGRHKFTAPHVCCHLSQAQTDQQSVVAQMYTTVTIHACCCA